MGADAWMTRRCAGEYSTLRLSGLQYIAQGVRLQPHVKGGEESTILARGAQEDLEALRRECR